jgi:hypothetical protein
MTYWEYFYGKCTKKPCGSPKCCAGFNWKPLGPKTFEEMLEHFRSCNSSVGRALV